MVTGNRPSTLANSVEVEHKLRMHNAKQNNGCVIHTVTASEAQTSQYSSDKCLVDSGTGTLSIDESLPPVVARCSRCRRKSSGQPLQRSKGLAGPPKAPFGGRFSIRIEIGRKSFYEVCPDRFFKNLAKCRSQFPDRNPADQINPYPIPDKNCSESEDRTPEFNLFVRKAYH